MSHRRSQQKKSQAKILEVSLEELGAIVERTKAVLSPEDHLKLKTSLDTLGFVMEEVRRKATSIKRLRAMLFGASTERTSQVVGDGHAGHQEDEKTASAATDKKAKGKPDKAKRKGHGRNGAAAYPGAEKVHIPHPTLHAGDGCPKCPKGHVYPLSVPAVQVRFTGVAPLAAKIYEEDQFRCNLCLEVFTAPVPEEVGEEKYDETATAMIGQLRYGSGLPFNRLEQLQQGMGIPLPAATQWELVRDGAELLRPVQEELIREAAQGTVLHNDDTPMTVLELIAKRREAALAGEETDGRTGVFTSGIVSMSQGHPIALFFTGVQHAGENLADVLAKREAGLPKPIQMCDALAANTAGDFETILANCNGHARRKYVEVAEDFPAECRFVLETLRDVYKNDAIAREQEMSPTQRLRFHKAESGPLMEGLEKWMKEQLAEHKVEPNSGLGEAIRYMQTHWSELTLFLRKAGAPLDNNICERALKKAIRHRKNSLFYKTLNGARVGDAFMSIIHTAELNEVKPFPYLVALLRNHQEVAKAPADWMPWNYCDTLARLGAKTDPPH